MPMLLLILLFAVADPTAAAQTDPAPAPPKPAAPSEPVQATPSAADETVYRVGPEDVLAVSVFGEKDLSGKVRVENDGSISFPYLNRVKVDGLTVVEIAEALTRGLADGYLRSPQVSVEIDQYHSRNVYVFGEVRAPNKYALPGNATLIDVLTLAGSTTGNAGQWVYINHARLGAAMEGPVINDENTQADLKVSLADIQSGKGQNILLQDGDTVFVPKAQVVYVMGQVRTPGAVPYTENMTVFEAVALAGGVTEKGSNSRISVRRLIKGQMKEFGVKQTDALNPGDQVNVKPRRL